MTPEQELLSSLAKASFRLNGQFMALAEQLARPAGLTGTRWQVLGFVLNDPLPVADIARGVGVTRQSVQRVADDLVEQGLAEYLENPAHRRAKLLHPTDHGRDAVRRIGPSHAALAERLAEHVGENNLRDALNVLNTLLDALPALTSDKAP
jgi:DNA-binding MarR family transcriptional regulator